MACPFYICKHGLLGANYWGNVYVAFISVWIDTAHDWISNINEYWKPGYDTTYSMAFSIFCCFRIQASSNHNCSPFTEKQLTSLHWGNSCVYGSTAFVWSSPYMYFACLDSCLHKIAFTDANWVIAISAKNIVIKWVEGNYGTSFALNTACFLNSTTRKYVYNTMAKG